MGLWAEADILGPLSCEIGVISGFGFSPEAKVPSVERIPGFHGGVETL